MKRDKLWLMLAAMVGLVLAFVPTSGGTVLSILAVPFTVLGWVLRNLSLSGALGNVLALVLYGAICAVPFFLWVRSRGRGADVLLLVMVPVLALVLYYMVNPNLRSNLLRNEVGDLIYAMPFWSVLMAWVVLKLVLDREVLERNIYRCLRIFLLLCGAGCLLDVFGTELRSLWFYLNLYGVSATSMYFLLRYAAVAAEGFLAALVLYRGTQLLRSLESAPFRTECVDAAEQVSNLCRRALVVITLSGLGLNLMQLLMTGVLMDVRMELNLPIMGLAVCFAMLAVTRLLVRGKELQDDNDLFV